MTLPILRSECPLEDCVGVDPGDKQKPYFARCDIELECGSHRAKLTKRKRWNGADIPRLGWSILGWSQHEPRSLIASGFHDDGCERDDVPQVIADAVFVTLLRPVEFEQLDELGAVVARLVLPGIGETRAAAGYIGVRGWSITKLVYRWAQRAGRRPKT